MKKQFSIPLRIAELVLHIVFLIALVVLTTAPVRAQAMQTAVGFEASGGAMLGEQDASISALPMASTSASKDTYNLPYAGLLPDSPLYFLKAIRDRLVDMLISDNLKKAEFTLLQADKRLSMAIALMDKGKPELAESTESKGQNYLKRTITLREKANREGQDVVGFTAKLRKSLEKHEDVLLGLTSRSQGSVKDSFVRMASDTAKIRTSLPH